MTHGGVTEGDGEADAEKKNCENFIRRCEDNVAQVKDVKKQDQGEEGPSKGNTIEAASDH